MRLATIMSGLLATAIVTAGVRADEPKKQGGNAKEIAAAFERLKKLAGEWEPSTGTEQFPKGKVTNRYQLTAGGSAVLETIFPGGDMEMVSVYYMEGDQLLMTHYCCMGNQPRFRARIGDNKDELVFDFAGGSNLDPAKDAHIHNGRVQFVDADHIKSQWDMHVDGKEGEKHGFELIRKK
jgi:hypothetical protein